ncbi:small secreted protein-like protein [Evansella cellulosilytica DSM 2522]|uniref:Small secreted protein-like protein n=1 Tax=Evansella cellulosilytica (strain ATCC 21833 / DSM 2522 / FERM P-1141 / JCM 9156 / N-4) TaxID=649639 RepID=E6U188_EVAC2|nr:PepSY domain-containing protein [Evansella cellulosilytica]ADU31534.1 small secreted protein-like protein [Evansella cellulosilytica DSM 2522]
MSWKRFAVGVGAGVAVTLIAKNQLDKNQGQLSPEKALKMVKRKAESLGSIDGSWVHMITEEYEQDQLKYDVYRGGITCTDDSGSMSAYEFYVDASSGAILKLEKQED